MTMNGQTMPAGLVERSDGRRPALPIGYNDKGEPVFLLVGAATSDGAIVTEIGSDVLYADGSLYISAIDGAGTLWQKRNDIWISI